MKVIQELIGKEATERLKERYGVLVDYISVEEQGPQIIKMSFQIIDRKKLSVTPTNIERREAVGVGVAEIEDALYHLLNFDEGDVERGIHFNNNLSRNGIYMHREIYAELMESEKESMRRIEERLERLDRRKKREMD